MAVLKFSRNTLEIDEFELVISCSDDSSTFSVTMYTTSASVEDFRSKLKKLHSSDDWVDIQFGKMGPEFAGGSANIRFYTREKQVFVTARMQGRHRDFDRFSVAPEAVIYAAFPFDALKEFNAELVGFVASELSNASLTE